MVDNRELNSQDSSTTPAWAANRRVTNHSIRRNVLRNTALLLLAFAIPCFVACSGGDSGNEDDGPGNSVPRGKDAGADLDPGNLDPGNYNSDASVADPTEPDPTDPVDPVDEVDASVDPEPSDGGSVSGLSASTVCSKVATATCNRISKCAQFGIQAMYGTAAKCAERGKVTCLAGLKLPGTSITVEKLNACISEVNTAECSLLASGNLDACKFGPGTLASGAKCIDSTQCKSEFCARAPTAACGTCAKAPAVGAACVNKACATGQFCTTVNKCVASTKKLGESCTYFEECDIVNGFVCDTMRTHKCTELKLASGTCGVDMVKQTITICPANGYCDGTTCKAAVKDGATCNAKTNCMPPALCLDGKCTVPSDATCK